ncbi:transposase [Escherichia coli]|uniref:Transposase n=1 Tax=Escherichia coli TaxID=562 RepID=A0A377D710_ECOLX|nr:transposase [Escherichia coli]
MIWQPEFTDKTLSRKPGAVQFGDLKFKYRNREFWCRGYYVDTVGKNTAKIQDYIKHQLEEDKMGEQLSIPYPGSPFTGRK